VEGTDEDTEEHPNHRPIVTSRCLPLQTKIAILIL
jgi:hypothetical protein